MKISTLNSYCPDIATFAIIGLGQRYHITEHPEMRSVMAEPLTSGIPIIYIDDETPNGEKGLFSSQTQLADRLGWVDSGDLTQNLSSMCTRLSSAFRKAQQSAGEFELDEFEVTLDLTATGEVRLVASVRAEIRGGLKLTFRRSRDVEPTR
jgi:hypothetical protein